MSRMWTDKHQQRWAAIRAKGCARFVLINGVLAYGLPMFVLMTVCPALFNFPFAARPSDTYWIWQPVGWAIAGAIFGSAMWWVSERAYRQYAAKSSGSSQPAA